MFGWLAKLLVSSPVVGSGCSCCEGKKESLRRMQEAIAEGDPQGNYVEEEKGCQCGGGSCHGNAERHQQTPNQGWSINSGTLHVSIGGNGHGTAEVLPSGHEKCSCGSGGECRCGKH